MSELRERALKSIFGAIEEVNEMLAEEERLKNSELTLLFGDAGELDSLGLINFMVALEGRMSTDFGLTINLIEELENPQEPLKSVGRLADFIVARVNGDGA
ncbi:MAG: hypothetical protein COV66_03665 [Nitrospinae bacterium CG11_big_fil_rev_8_21_14_0_20_45_15]|nr:MAG: hypothetical protein COV66_03665 [Nitrospinae bacterium CG11_big_fil_rev_8_21_14_0_20_45_15]